MLKYCTTGKNISFAWLPLVLLLDEVHDGRGVWIYYNSKIMIMLSEVLGQFQGEPLLMEDPLETAKLRDMSCILLPVRVKRPYDVMMLPQKIGERMTNKQDGSIDCLHAAECPD